MIGILNRQIDKISPSGDNDDKYKIVGGKYPISISRHAFIYVLVIVTSLSLCITLFALNKVLRIEKNETGILPAVPVGQHIKQKVELNLNLAVRQLKAAMQARSTPSTRSYTGKQLTSLTVVVKVPSAIS